MKQLKLCRGCDVVAVRDENEDEDSCCCAVCQPHSSECITWPQLHYSQYKHKCMVLLQTLAAPGLSGSLRPALPKGLATSFSVHQQHTNAAYALHRRCVRVPPATLCRNVCFKQMARLLSVNTTPGSHLMQGKHLRPSRLNHLGPRQRK